MIVTGAGRARERVAEHYSHEENRAALKQVMRREKTLDQLFKRAQADAEAGEAAPAKRSRTETFAADEPASA